MDISIHDVADITQTEPRKLDTAMSKPWVSTIKIRTMRGEEVSIDVFAAAAACLRIDKDDE
jgi:hypothetical protein